MGPLSRPPLSMFSAQDRHELRRYQREANQKKRDGTLDSTAFWKAKRGNKPLKVTVMGALRSMAGDTERCMYCHDSQGTDIEHFYPKVIYPNRMFRWANLLLCCSGCGSRKGDHFPLSGATPLLINPTTENPWDCLDFDPTTGSITARFDTTINTPSVRGKVTVDLLHLDRREAMAKGYTKTYRRLKKHIEDALTSPPIDHATFIDGLKDDDDHGLLVWCFHALGANTVPFSTLRAQNPTLWNDCVIATAP